MIVSRCVRNATCLLVVSGFAAAASADGWRRHTIDRSSVGADGVRLGDVDQDGQLDIVTGWEEGGIIRVCFQPLEAADRAQQVRRPWPSVTVGKVKSAEDAVPVDINSDGWMDIVSCCEGATQNIFLHLNPGNAQKSRQSAAWKTKPLKSAKGVTRWMYCVPLSASKLVFGSKNPIGQIALCDLSGPQVKWTVLRSCDWIMSLRIVDIDNDGRDDIVYSDRKGSGRQVGWLRQPSQADSTWSDHVIGGKRREVMFLDLLVKTAESPQKPGDRPRLEIACQTKDGGVLLLSPGPSITKPWQQTEVPQPAGTGSGKGVALGDLNGDGKPDLACSCEHSGSKVGVYGLIRSDTGWDFMDISGNQDGTKFDRIELLDLDQDGDLDLLTCEERENLGVVWYENPQVP